jgi:hypothetical protein
MNSIPRSSHTAVSESTAKKLLKVLDHLLVRRSVDGGHIVEHHYTHPRHKAEIHTFGKDEVERTIKHLLRHAGLPHPKLEIEEQGGSQSEPRIGRIQKSFSYGSQTAHGT